MNSVHDMGGMHGMGPIQQEKNEPVFHARWEARVFALNRAVGAWGKWNIDASRHQKEQIPAAEYLRMSYYEKFLVGMTELLIKSGLVSAAEVQSGKPARGSKRVTPALTADKVPVLVAKGTPASRNTPAAPKFHVGQRIRTRNINPAGHTRLPRYARGKFGTIERDHGVFVFPDTNAHFAGENPQHVYSVRFDARELWGAQASPQDAVYVNLWDDHLDQA
jgi:nitrile hydratase beta subunit